MREVLAKEAIESGRLPARPADRLSDAPGDGANCTVCAQPLSPQALGYELVFMQDKAAPAVHFLHVPCFVAWQSQFSDAVSAIQSGPHDEKARENGHVNGQDRGGGR